MTASDFIAFDADQAALGQLLFYDKILSGNRNIACATCHHPDFGTSDGVSLGIGEGGVGLGPQRTPGTAQDRIHDRIPRNAPALWNLGARGIHTLFHDGRLSISDKYGNGFDSPAEERLPKGLGSVLAAQALFPLTSHSEMAGHTGENEVAGAAHNRIDTVWPILAKRVRTIPAYGDAFVVAFDHIDSAEQVTIVDIANALAAFMGTEWQSYDSPFDAYLAGDDTALDSPQKSGLELFYGRAQCSDCHAGSLLTDQSFHALALPQFGPGRTRPFDPIPRDVGRMSKSDELADAYRFRTPMLRNVALTAPYGHNGAYPTLEGIIRHHVDVSPSWTPNMANLPDVPWLTKADFAVQDDRLETERHARYRDTKPVALSDRDINDLVSFLHALTGATVDKATFGVPEAVPSGLPLD